MTTAVGGGRDSGLYYLHPLNLAADLPSSGLKDVTSLIVGVDTGSYL